MKNFKIKSYCKINLSLRIIKKLKNGYHNISSLITFSDLHDVISISKIKKHKDKITFSGKFSNYINSKSNTITAVLKVLRKKKLIKNQSFKINVKKNIPHGSGLGGASSNASYLLNYFNNKMKFKLKKNEMISLAKKIGSDVPICLEKKNTFLTGKNNKMLRINHKFNLNLLIVYPNIICSTRKIYKRNRINNSTGNEYYYNEKNRAKLNYFLKNDKNDLEKIVIKIYPRIGKIINYIRSQKGCVFSRITGSGSACIGIFSNRANTISAQKLIRSKYPKYWCVASKTI
ncbi:4-(cytidine 5'-diphospho)-2-C-methyl-D-erythritol kinase [Pelagibacteraceae bacterium]|nr:4-(cytidine 5'-diphospho)-2-C-methyl-D-erythritol kinase [Pelagibacteraceae bacterium]